MDRKFRAPPSTDPSPSPRLIEELLFITKTGDDFHSWWLENFNESSIEAYSIARQAWIRSALDNRHPPESK